jgi:hypothetical protein
MARERTLAAGAKAFPVLGTLLVVTLTVLLVAALLERREDQRRRARTLELLGASPGVLAAQPEGVLRRACSPHNRKGCWQPFPGQVVERPAETSLVDFHSLRSTYATLLARAGVGLKQAQVLTRHKTLDILARDYVKLELVDARAAVAKLPRVVGAGVGEKRQKPAETRGNAGAGDPPRENASGEGASLVSSAPVALTTSSPSGGIGRRARFRV